MKTRKTVSILTLTALISQLILPLPMVSATNEQSHKQLGFIGLSDKFTPVTIKGLKVFPDNPMQFDFIVEQGDARLNTEELEFESAKLIRYFLASLTVPEQDLWVNLSPYEKDRIVPEAFGITEMGRDMLAQDYLLKKISASLLYPEDTIGKKFWSRIQKLAFEKFGTSEMPTNTFNKIWVVPEQAVVYENAAAGTAYIVESKLKVLLEEDYLALKQEPNSTTREDVNALGSQIIREIVIPELTKEINENKHFALLRQIYSSYILATWYKQKIKNSVLNQVYSDQNKIAGVNIDDPQEKQKIYHQYLEAFRQGAYNYIKEEYDPASQEMIPRKYFSGGFKLAWTSASSPLTITDRLTTGLKQTFTSTLVGLSIISASIAPLTEHSSTALPPSRMMKKEITKAEEETEALAAGAILGEDFYTHLNKVLLGAEQKPAELSNVPAAEVNIIQDPANRANDSNFGELGDTSVESTIARRDIDLISSRLGFPSDRSNDVMNLVIARETYVFFKNLEEEFTKKLGAPVTFTVTATTDVLYQDDGALPMPGIQFTYHLGSGVPNQTNIIGRFMINRKPGERTYLLSGLLSRDVSDPKKQVVVTAYTNNYDYDKEYTLGELADLVQILENVLGKENLEKILTTTLKEDSLELFKQIYGDIPGEKFHSEVVAQSRSTGQTFYETVNLRLGGETYRSLGPIIKLLARAAGSLSIEQIERTAIADKSNLLSVTRAFSEQERTNTPSQKYPANFAVTLSLFAGAKILKELAIKHQIKLVADVAMPDGLPNITFYKRMGFKTTLEIEELLKQFEGKRATYKEQGKKIDLAQITWELYAAHHQLSQMTFDPTEYFTNFRLDNNSPITQDVLRTLEQQIPGIAQTIRLPVELTNEFYNENFMGRNLPAQRFSFTVDRPKGPGSEGESEKFEIGTFSLILDKDSLLIAHLAFNDPRADPKQRVVITADDADYSYSPAQSKKALADLKSILEKKLGQERYAALMSTDFGEAQYVDMLVNLIGRKGYNEIINDMAAGFTPIPVFGDPLPVENNVNGFLESKFGFRVNYPESPLALRLIALAAAGLTEGQLEALELTSKDGINSLVEALLKPERAYLPSQRFQSSNAMTTAFMTTAKSLRDIGAQNGLAAIKFEVDVRGAFQNLLLYMAAGYQIDYPYEAPLLQAVTQFYLMSRSSMNLKELSWTIYRGGLDQGLFLNRPHSLTFVHDLHAVGQEKSSARQQLEKIANTEPGISRYYQLTGRDDIVRDLRVASSSVGGIDFNPNNMMLITQNDTGEIEFMIDPAIVKQLNEVPGFIPVINRIQPVSNLQFFLGAALQ